MKHREAPDFPPSFLPEAVKNLGYGERRGFTHVQGPKKFACQNDAVLSLLPAGESTSVRLEGQSLCFYMVLFQLAGVPSRRAGYPLGIIPVPPILAARIFPTPGQQERVSPSRFEFFHSFLKAWDPARPSMNLWISEMRHLA